MTTFSRRGVGALAILVLVAGCAADRLHREGLAALDRGDYEIGITKLDEAVRADPRNMEYRLDLTARREESVQTLVAQADAARAAGKLDVAAQTYRRVLTVDPANDRARRGLAGLEGDARHAATVAAARKDFDRKDYDAADAKLRAVLAEDPGFTAAADLANAITVARGPTTVAPKLKTRDNRKVSLQFRDAPTKMVFEVLSRETGINFILDKEIKSDGKTTIFVQDVPVEEAIDLVLDQNALARQILSSNMVLIYPNNPAKQKEYQEEIVRTFYITNAQPKDVEGMLKTVLGAKTLFVDERTNLIVMRDTPDAVRMAEKLVASLDVAEPEVMLEVEVLEISRSRLQDLGIAYPPSATFSATSLATGATASAGLRLSDLGHQNSNSVTVSPLSVTLNAMKQSGMTNTLASPRIRARNREKAKVLIGQREPVITNSVTPTAGGQAVVTGNVQYIDVGLTLEVQPTIYLDSDVAIKINLEVSSLLKQVTTTGGTIAYEIGTRNANTLLRLKDGETQILAGLIQDSDTRTANSIPGLGDIPILGHLFGTNHSDKEKNEIVLSITPRIIRTQPRPASEDTEFWFGTESRTRTAPYSAAGSIDSTATSPGNDSQQTSGSAAPQAGITRPGIPPSVLPQQTTPVPSPQGMPISAPPAAIAPNASPPSSSANSSAAASNAAMNAPPVTAAAESGGSTSPEKTGGAGGGRAAVSLDGPADVHVGDEFQVVVRLSTQDALTHLRSQVRFDPTAIQLLAADTGDAVPASAGGPQVSSRPGGAQLEINASQDAPVQGNGSLMVLHFKALGPRPSTSIAAMLSVIGGNGAAVGNGSATPLNLVIQ